MSRGEIEISVKKIVTIGIAFICIIVALLFSRSIFETVEKGTYQVKQAAISGTMSAKMSPGLWLQLFGDIEAAENRGW